ncbi:FadR/GntR family transcriptional regulator [Rhodococcus rhodochrous]|uniref:FadR/GntR family transcriptional regulator n=1 Tax=Rhodococcus rhodochrous TaxID=1829 RepID=UPI0009C027CC|nr:GntR family transcriptional regulator [Rhodococcus rhodochrous]
MSDGKPLRRSSLTSQVIDQLQTEISSGRWRIGDHIPTEIELCELTGTGRNTVREAVQALVYTRVLERRQGSGTYVIATTEDKSALDEYLDSAHKQDVWELRQALDVSAAALAVHRCTSEEIFRLEQLRDERRRRVGGSDTEVEVAEVALRRAMVESSHNALYLKLYNLLILTLRGTGDCHIPVLGAGLYDRYGPLIEAVIAGDEVAISRAAKEIIVEGPRPGSRKG